MFKKIAFMCLSLVIVGFTENQDIKLYNIHQLVENDKQNKIDSLNAELNKLEKIDIGCKSFLLIHKIRDIKATIAIMGEDKINGNIINETVKPKSSIMAGAGTVQIIGGIAALICTIVDANKTNKIEIPSTGKNKTTVEYKNKWGAGHTAMTILSSTLILSGIITINF
jgi:hypothetical protein